MDRGRVLLPNFLIIGAMRSGTTSLAINLRGHPDVFVAPQKEVRYFDRHFHRGIEWYARQFRGASGELAIGEATPNYMYSGEAMERIAETLPDVRMIAIIRDPVNRAYSHYWLNRSLRIEDLPFAKALAMEAQRLSSGCADDVAYVDRGRYIRQFERICRRFPRERLLILLFEDFKCDPSAVYREACRFLGVGADFMPSHLEMSVNKYVTFRSVRVFHLARRLPNLPMRVVDRLNTRTHVRYPPMDPEIRASLRLKFMEDNVALSAWLGRDLGVWTGTVRGATGASEGRRTVP